MTSSRAKGLIKWAENSFALCAALERPYLMHLGLRNLLVVELNAPRLLYLDIPGLIVSMYN